MVSKLSEKMHAVNGEIHDHGSETIATICGIGLWDYNCRIILIVFRFSTSKLTAQ
jgi:hypothetical protein